MHLGHDKPTLQKCCHGNSLLCFINFYVNYKILITLSIKSSYYAYIATYNYYELLIDIKTKILNLKRSRD